MTAFSCHTEGIHVLIAPIGVAESRSHAADRLITLLDHRVRTVRRRCPSCGSDQHGAPEVAGSPLHFSISYSGGWAAASAGQRSHGIDIEADDGREFVATSVLSPAEQSVLRDPRRDRFGAFLQLWTAKEAIGKQRGTGLLDDPAELDCAELLDNRSAVVQHHLVTRLDLPGPLIGSVAVSLIGSSASHRMRPKAAGRRVNRRSEHAGRQGSRSARR